MVALELVLWLVLPLILRAHMHADADFRFASYIDNYMVLQKEPAGAVIWGYGIPGATVTVTLCQDQETIMKKVTPVKAYTNSWMVILDPMKPGGPYEVVAKQTFGGMNLTLRIHDVLFGDVWLCSGQSNMQMTVSQFAAHIPEEMPPSKRLGDTGKGYQEVIVISVSIKRQVARLPMLPPQAGISCDEALEFPVSAEASVGGENGSSSIHCFHGSSRRSLALSEELNFKGSDSLQIFNATRELSNTAAYQSVRIFVVSLVQAEQELADLAEVDLPWSQPTSENLGHGDFEYMSATCWLFGRYLYDTLQYPIGLVSSSWGGTPIEAWSSVRSLKACGIPKQRFIPSDYIYGPNEYSVLWNAMIHPLRNMALKGVIWYQGEANVHLNMDLYNCTFPALIKDWRQTFHLGSQGQTEHLFPFGFVQLSSVLSSVDRDDGFPQIRWHQTADFGYVPNRRMPNTFMAVAMDLCDRNSPFGSIHPRDKQTVAYRLHLGARAVAYGEKLLFQGPLPEEIELWAVKGLLNITYTQQIQVQRQDDKIFEISCCDDHHQCKWLPAPMNTFSTHTLVLSISSCPGTPVALRYAWTTWPCEYKQCPVYHASSALPAPPFTAFITNQMLLNDLVAV